MNTPRLRYWRERKALSLRELAALAGVAYRTVWRLENGYQAEGRTIRKLAAALDIEPHELMEGDDQGNAVAA